MNRTSTLLFAFAIPFLLHAQKALTLRDAILKAGTEYSPERLRGLQWIEGSITYSYIKDDKLMRGTLGKSVDLPIIDLATLNQAVSDTVKLKAIPMITWLSSDRYRFFHNGRYHVHTLGSRTTETTVLPAEAANEDIHAKTGAIAYTVDKDLYIHRPGQKGDTRVTSDGMDGIVNGQSVHRQEYGITKGTFWSPDGNLLAFYRMDERMVSPYFLEDIGTRPSTFEKIRYPMAGDTSHQVTVGIHDLRTGKTTFLRTATPADHYLTNIGWSADEQQVTVAHLDRATEHLKLISYDPLTGEPKATLLEEHDEKYLEPQHPAVFLKTKRNQYIWQSQRDGWNHLYRYDATNRSVEQLTKGQWLVKDVVGMDPKETFIIVEGTAEIIPGRPAGALETHLYRVELNSGKVKRLTQEPGTHHGQLSSDGSTLIDTWNSVSVPGEVVLRDSRTGQRMKVLLTSKDPLDGITKGSIELLNIPGAEGDYLNARLIKPSHFNKDKRYPVLIYVYNGPHVQLVSNGFLGGASLWMLEAAERGYLVWTVDGHGSANRGRTFEQAIHRHLGELEVKDQMRGVDYLKGLPFVDVDRIGVHGWSFGGHMTTAMLTRHPGVFKAGVAGGPVMDWGLYEVMYTERYMDTPAENPEGYASTDLTRLADKLQEPLLIITGGKDDTVLPQHAYSFLKACVDKGVPVDFFDYPGHGHNVRGKDRVHLMEKVLDYLDRHLVPSKG
ncbi:MAG: DPP IV N-terminal domain-containing protein [Flavobacteriales bacterium]|nr:DPP IV N-terminal domain-containing protein [Flavobacteriales bacterium]